MLNILKGKDVINYIQLLFECENILKFIVFNESPIAGHLWYLGVVLYVLVIVFLLDRLGFRKRLYYLILVLLILDLVLGKYSLLVLKHEFSYILVRNFLFVGISYFGIGDLIRENYFSAKWDEKKRKDFF